MRIMIADDDPILLLALTKQLTQRGHKIFTARDAMQAVMVTMRELPDVILLDIGMPAGTGFEALKRLQASTKTAVIPVVIITSDGNPELESKAKESGAARLLRKGFSCDQLLDELSLVMQTQTAPPAAPTSTWSARPTLVRARN